MTAPNDEERLRIYAAFGLTPEDVAAFEATPEYRSYVAAKEDAEAAEAAFRSMLAARAEAACAGLTAKLAADLGIDELEVRLT